MRTNSLSIKYSARTRQAAKKAGISIEEQNETKRQQPNVEQEQPDIM